MKNIVINYALQNDKENSACAYFLPPTFNNIQELKIKDILEYFPLKNSGQKYHFRFKTITSRDPKIIGWLDISNLNAKAPLYENQVHMKVLPMPNERGSKIFRDGSDYAKTMSKIANDQLDPKVKPVNPQKNVQPPEPQYINDNPQFNKKPEPQPNIKTHQPKQQPPQSSNVNLIEDMEDIPTKKNDSGSKGTNIADLGADFMNPQNGGGSKYDGLTHEQITAIKAQEQQDAINKKQEEFLKNMAKEEQAKADRKKAYEEFEDKIRKWAFQGTQRNNITTLLITVHEICWANCEWQPLGLSDCMSPSQIRKNYFKAIRFFHPDKNQNTDFKKLYIADRVFNILNEAWNDYQSSQK